MQVDLKRLRQIVILARVRHYSRAAKEIGISQSALTKAVQAVEAELGVRLFDRDRSGVQVTPAGQVVLAGALDLLAEADEFEHQVVRLTNSGGGEIVFGMAPMPAHALLARVLDRFMQENPEISFRAVTHSPTAMLEMLVAGEIEFFVALEDQIPFDPSIGAEIIGSFPINLIARPGHPLLRGSSDDQRYPLLIAGSVSLPGHVSTALTQHLSGMVHIVQDHSVLTRLAQTSDGIWLSSKHTATDEIRSGTLAVLPWPEGSVPPAAANLEFYTIARRRLSSVSRKMKAIMSELMQEI